MDPSREKAGNDKQHMHFVCTYRSKKVTKYMVDNFDMYDMEESVRETIKHCEAF